MTDAAEGRAAGDRDRDSDSDSGSDRDSDAERIRTAVLAQPDVAALFAGGLEEIASTLPGPAVSGVRVDDERVEVHVVARYGPPLRDVAAGIAAAVDPVLAGRSLSVAVEDILLPGETLAPGTDDAAPAE